MQGIQRFFFISLVSFFFASCGDIDAPKTQDSEQPNLPKSLKVYIAENSWNASRFLNKDQRGNAVTYEIDNGADKDAFQLTNVGDEIYLTFKVRPDFENPHDINTDNIYEVKLKATINNVSSSLDLQVNIRDVFDKQFVLNDTGLQRCGNEAIDGTANNDAACDAAVPSKQDAELGRDANMTLTKQGSGEAGFDFSKIDSTGSLLSSSAASWSCVQDHLTGLMWESKQDSGLHKKTDKYTWYNNDNKLNGGNAGDKGAAAICENYSDADDKRCNTEDYLKRVNQAALCGATDWRLPTTEELQGILNYGDTSAPMIDSTYYANTQASEYWSVSPSAQSDQNAWVVNFSSGAIVERPKVTQLPIRLVRGAR